MVYVCTQNLKSHGCESGRTISRITLHEKDDFLEFGKGVFGKERRINKRLSEKLTLLQ